MKGSFMKKLLPFEAIYALFRVVLFTPAGLEAVLKARPLSREFLAQIGIRLAILTKRDGTFALIFDSKRIFCGFFHFSV